jgi:hypothetical protein
MMMTNKVYRSAMGKTVDMGALVLRNEHTRAVGNQKVNARGDQLGPGGKVETTRDKIMQDHYKLNTPLAVDEPPQPRRKEVKKDLVDEWVEPAVEEPQQITPEPVQPKLRGSLADSVAKNQPAVKPPVKRSGPSRI